MTVSTGLIANPAQIDLQNPGVAPREGTFQFLPKTTGFHALQGVDLPWVNVISGNLVGFWPQRKCLQKYSNLNTTQRFVNQ